MLLALASFFWCSLSTVMAGFLVTGRFLRLDDFGLPGVVYVGSELECATWLCPPFISLRFISDSSCVRSVNILIKLLICR